ncbi:MAG: class I SAM-dependent methyltransferase [Chloroflexi bacterium]|nr:class I SAM-dependent methyltransferase [Chloroflexota bacterium]
MSNPQSKIPNPKSKIRTALRLYEGESPGIRLFVRARHLLAPLEQIAASVPPQGNVLDVGCGHGLFSLLLALVWPDRHILGVDPSPAKIEVARRVGRALPNVEFRLGSVEAAGERAFQAVALLDVLYLLPPEQKLRLLRGCRQALAPSGVLLVKTNDTHPAWKFALTRFQEWAMTSLGLTLGHGGLSFQPCEANRQLLRQAGFDAQVRHLRHWSPYPHVLFTARPSMSRTGEPPVPPGSPTGEPPVPPTGSPVAQAARLCHPRATQAGAPDLA